MANLEKMYNDYYDIVLKFVLSRVRNKEIALDITQDTFVRACENYTVIEQNDQRKTKAWLLTVANNLCIDFWRKNENSLASFYDAEQYLKLQKSSIGDDPLRTIRSEQLSDIITESISSLKYEHQQAITLFDIKQLSYRECAKILGISEVAFSSLLRRARKSLIGEIIKNSAPNIVNKSLSDREIKKIIYWFDILDIPANISEEIATKSRNFFNGLMENYETVRAETYPEQINEFLISNAKITNEQVVADIGCGSGDLSFKLSPLVKKVYAIDHSVEMLSLLDENIEKNNVNNIYRVLAEVGSEYELPNEYFDLAFCTMVLHHVFDPKEAIVKIAQTLVKGEQLIIADIAHTKENWKFKDIHDFWSGFKLPQMSRWLEQAGLKVVHLEENIEHCFTFKDVTNNNKTIKVPLMYAKAIKEF